MGIVRTSRNRRVGMWLVASWALWTLFGVFSAGLAHFRSSFTKHPYDWPTCLYSELGYAYIAAVLSIGVIWLSKRFSLLMRPVLLHFFIHLTAALVYASVCKVFWDLLRVGSTASYLTSGFSFLRLFQSVNFGWDSGVLLYAIILLSTHALEYYQRYQQGIVRNSDLEAQLARAQLQALKMQLHPHFLFNALHTASALVRVNPQAAEKVLAQLGDLLRITLESTESQEVGIMDELALLDRYLDIERTRFEDRLKVEFEVDSDVEGALVPHFILQPLVENALRHGAGTRVEGAQIRVAATTEEGSLKLRVWDNGPDVQRPVPEKMQEGVGLSTTRARLERLYGNAQHLLLRRLPSGQFEAVITMPLRLAAKPSGGM